MSNQVNAKAGLSVKDLVTTGIFTALLFVFIMWYAPRQEDNKK